MSLTGGRRLIRPGMALAAVAIATARGGSEDLRIPPSPPRAEGVAAAIAVDRGRARFALPSAPADSDTLVVVSSLSRQPGPYSIRLAIRPGGVGETPPRGVAGGVGSARSPIARVEWPPAADPEPSPPDSPPRPIRTFHLLVHEGDVASASNYIAAEGILRGVGRHVQVYVDRGDRDRVGADVVRDIVRTFDDRIFPASRGTIGLARDLDGDGRFTVFLSGWLSHLAGGRHAVDGFVRGADLDPDLAAPFSNHCDMMYLNSRMRSGPYLRTILAHEYTHAAAFSRKALGGPTGRRTGAEEEAWLDEAIAHLGEDLHGFSRANLHYRISAFLSRPERYRLVVADYYSADLFRSHGNRGATYLFLRWCADRFGPGLLPALIRSPRRGVENLESSTGCTFERLYREWSTALFLDGLGGGEPRGRGLRSLSLRDPLEGWELAGPRFVSLAADAGSGEDRWMAAGTSSHYVVVGASGGGAMAIEVDGPAEAELQVTTVRLPAGRAKVDLSLMAIEDHDGTTRLRARITERSGHSVRLEGLAWEPLTPAVDPLAPGFRCGGLDATGLLREFGTTTLPAGGRIESSAIAFPRGTDRPGPFVVKLIGTDANGHRVAAWGEVEPAGSDAAGPAD